MPTTAKSRFARLASTPHRIRSGPRRRPPRSIRFGWKKIQTVPDSPWQTSHDGIGPRCKRNRRRRGDWRFLRSNKRKETMVLPLDSQLFVLEPDASENGGGGHFAQGDERNAQSVSRNSASRVSPRAVRVARFAAGFGPGSNRDRGRLPHANGARPNAWLDSPSESTLTGLPRTRCETPTRSPSSPCSGGGGGRSGAATADDLRGKLPEAGRVFPGERRQPTESAPTGDRRHRGVGVG